MQLTEIRINLCGSPTPPSHNPAGANGNGARQPQFRAAGQGGRLRAFCSLTFDDTFVI